MGNCLKSTSSDDLTLLNGRTNDSNRESIDQEISQPYPVSRNLTFLMKKYFVIYLCSVRFNQKFRLPCLRCKTFLKDFANET